MKRKTSYIKMLLPACFLLGGAAPAGAQVIRLSGADGFERSYQADQVDSVMVRPGIYLDENGQVQEKKNIVETLRGHKTRRFNTLLRLMADVSWGSKLYDAEEYTLFAADDDAFAAFFASCGWKDAKGAPVGSYEQLTAAQKSLLLRSMVIEGQWPLRRLTALGYPMLAGGEDSRSVLPVEDFPVNLSEIAGEEKPWDRLKQQHPEGVTLKGGAPNQIVVFRKYPLEHAGVNYSDVAFILGLPESDPAMAENYFFVNGVRIAEANLICTNGCCHVMDGIAVLPSDIPAALRAEGTTGLFSMLLERFSRPLATEEDGVFERTYDLPLLGGFKTLYVPDNEAMAQFFIQGKGRILMEVYGNKPNTLENLPYNICQVPREVIRPLVENLLKSSFGETVPGNYLHILNDAGDAMFPGTVYPSEEDFRRTVKKVLLTAGGVVYVMNHVVQPAAFANVMAPVLFSDNAKIVRSVATADENYIQGASFNNAPFKQYYSTFMKAMQSRFSFFVPTDEALGSYGLVDPMSLARSATGFHRYWRLEYADRNNPLVPIRATAFWFDETAGSRPEDTRKPSGTTYANVSEPSQSLQSLTNGAGLVKKKLLLEMMDQHIIVHDSSDEQGMTGPARYYMSRGGAPVLVKSKGDASNNNVGMVVNGGFQVQLNSDGYPDNDHDCVVTEGYDQTGGVADGVKGYGNGMTYFLDRPMQPTTRSVYNVLGGDEEHFSEFFELCNISFSEDLLKLAGFKKQIVVNAAEGTMRDMTPDEWSAEQDKYRIFTNASGYNPAEDEKLVRFFNNYRYTVYVPTNAAIEEARAKGLPMYDDILRFIEDNTVTTDGVDALSPENQLKAQAMITMLVNFVKYHFQDQSFFVDNVSSEGRYQTFCADNERNAFLDLTMRQTPGAITVTDGAGVTQNVVAPYNIMARDANFDRPPSSTATDISNSSYVVIHQVGKVLNFAPLEGGRYDGAWATVKKARDFVRRYAVR